jgi:hypothetical protein
MLIEKVNSSPDYYIARFSFAERTAMVPQPAHDRKLKNPTAMLQLFAHVLCTECRTPISKSSAGKGTVEDERNMQYLANK